MVKRRECVPIPLPDASMRCWYLYVDEERKKKGDEIKLRVFIACDPLNGTYSRATLFLVYNEK